MNKVIVVASHQMIHNERIAEELDQLGSGWKIVSACSTGFVAEGQVPFGKDFLKMPVLTVITTVILEK